MANRIINLPVATSGPGAPVDVSQLCAPRTVTLTGAFAGALTIEISQDGQSWSTAHSFVRPGRKQLVVAAAWMRANVIRGTAGGVLLVVGGPAAATRVELDLDVPAGAGEGDPRDISHLGPCRTILVAGGFSGSLAVEESDDGESFTPVAHFSRDGYATIQSSASWLRVARGNGATGRPRVDVAGTELEPPRRLYVSEALSVDVVAELDSVVRCDPSDGPMGVLLPPSDPTTRGGQVTIKNVSTSSNPITVSCFESDVIDGDETLTIAQARGHERLVADGAGGWMVC